MLLCLCFIGFFDSSFFLYSSAVFLTFCNRVFGFCVIFLLFCFFSVSFLFILCLGILGASCLAIC